MNSVIFLPRFTKAYLVIAFIFISGILFFPVQAQWKWNNPQKAGFKVIQNQAWTDEIGDTYNRLPDRAKTIVRPEVWRLSNNSAGLAVYFYSNAPEILIRYKVNGSYSMPHMPATGVSGVDLYSIDSDGRWNFNFGKYSFKDTITYHYQNIPKDRHHDYGYEYRLYLPLYNQVEWLEIGVPEAASFEFIPVLQDRPVVLYGTSITQGACASRPAMAWSTILQRAVDHPLVNLGFSGNGRLEKPVIDLINEIDASVYILDCLPNLSGRSEDEVCRLVIDGVKQLRTKRTTPILLLEHAGCFNAETNTISNNDLARVNQASQKAYETLVQDGIKDLYYLSRDALGISRDGSVDNVHLSDLGMQQQASAVEAVIRKILKEFRGKVSTTIPVTQRREPGTYEWMKRHNAIIDLNKKEPPKAVIIGNSITHYWGGKPDGPIKSGADSWEQVMAPAGYHNLGFGWDRIENVLWRVYHGEIDCLSIRKITVMIGTNNLGTNTDDDIVEGLDFLVSAIKERRPGATIKVIGILPRRNDEQRILFLNRKIKKVILEKGCVFADPGNRLLDKSGKIDESFFRDGLHPNAKGYQVIAKDISI